MELPDVFTIGLWSLGFLLLAALLPCLLRVRAHETGRNLVCRLLLEKKKKHENRLLR